MGGKQAGKSRAGRGNSSRQGAAADLFFWWLWTGTDGLDGTVVPKVIAVKNHFFYKLLKDSMLEYWREGTRQQIVRIGWSQQSKSNEAGMRSTEQVVGLDFRITLLFSCSNIGQIGSLSLSNVCLQQQNVCHDKQNKNVCRDKHTFVATKRQTRVCNDKTRLLSRQKLACRDKHFFLLFFSCDKYLSRQAN